MREPNAIVSEPRGANASLLICLSHGFHVRNIIYSRLYTQLVSAYRVTLVFPSSTTIPHDERHLLRGAAVAFVSIVPHRFEGILQFLRKSVFAGRRRTQTYNLITELERDRHPLAYRLANWCNVLLGRIGFVGRLWQWLEGRFIRGTEFDSLLANIRPALVITANYGTEGFEIRLLRAARRQGIASVSIVPSWDNLSSKGVIGAEPDHLVVWNSIMRDEAVSLYGFQRSRVHVCGALQFDAYSQPPSLRTDEPVLRHLGIALGHPFVVIGTITPRYFPHNLDIVDILNRAVSAGELPSDLQLVVRLHPQVVSDSHFGDDLDMYRERAATYSRIKLSIPRVLNWGSIVPPVEQDTFELMVLLRHAAAAIMPASTLAIDACATQTPVIGIGFDGAVHQPYERSIRRMFDFTHYRRIVASGGLRIAESRDMLVAEVSAYLTDRARDHDGRRTIVSTHLGRLDGCSWQRVLEVIAYASAAGLQP